MQFTTLNVLALAASATAATLKVAVGQNGLTFTPNDIKAVVGDSVEFSFFPANHTVTQSSFNDPCHPLDGGFFSGFVPTMSSPSGTTFTVTVQDTKPIWVYCSQPKKNHCQSGMVAAINAPAQGKTLEAFTLLAKNATLSTAPPSGPIGGVLNVGSGMSGSDSSSNSTGSTTLSTSSYTTTYSTTAVVTSEATSVYTSSGVAYTTSWESTYTTSYGTTVATAAVATVTGSATSGTDTPQSAGARSVTSGMAVIVAAIVGAMLLA